ncbi:MAG: hypothetical protein KIT84_19680 [Labilithrix sp.]|nr:hypothetical protein [Labilithrix sp.]MCW5813258.1 hypothetical protein [Labilithrix sp.]
MRLLAILAFGSMAVACASSTTNAVGTTTVTSSEVAEPESRESSPRAEEPTGQRVCRTTNIHDGTTELFLDWKKGSATGLLRRTAPSGVVTEQKVNAERVKGSIIADDVHSQDLAVHAAQVRDHKGRTYMRLGESKSGWFPCE